jgi:hypothetical protein
MQHRGWLEFEETRCWTGVSGWQFSTLRVSSTASHKRLRWHGIQRRMVTWATVINGRYRNRSLGPRSCSDLLGPASCCRDWSSLIVALCAALLLLHCPGPVRSGIRTQTRVQGSNDSRIPLAHMATGHLIRCRSCLLPLRSTLRSQRSDAKSTTSEIGLTSFIFRPVSKASDVNRKKPKSERDRWLRQSSA